MMTGMPPYWSYNNKFLNISWSQKTPKLTETEVIRANIKMFRKDSEYVRISTRNGLKIIPSHKFVPQVVTKFSIVKRRSWFGKFNSSFRLFLAIC